MTGINSLDDPVAVSDGDTPKMFDDTSDEAITVLVVDDDADMLDLTATFLERERDEFEVFTASSPPDAMDRLEDEPIDAIVSDYEMPRVDGLEFLDTVRDEFDDIPFILFTGRGSEEIASEAISKGVTDYLQKETGATQYSILANRLINAVVQYRASEALKRSQEKFSKLVVNSSDVIAIVNENAQFEYISPACKHVLGYEQEELIGTVAFDYMPPDDRRSTMERFFAALENPGMEPSVEFRFEHPEEGWIVIEARGKNLFDDDFINGFVVNARDITALKKQQQELKQQNEQLKDMRRVLSHDLRSPINVAADSLQLYRETNDRSYLEKIENAITRIETLLDQVVSMSEQGMEINTTDETSLERVVESAWEMTEAEDAELHVENSKRLEADRSGLQQVFENLIENSIEHSAGEVTIKIGTSDSTIYYEDTGPGIPEPQRDEVFELGYTTDQENTGFGLNIVKQIVIGHGWEIEITEGEEGGARFEISGVTFKPAVYKDQETQ